MKQYFQYNWWKYLAVVLIPVLLWTGIFDVLKKPAPNQRVHILCIGSGFDIAALEQQLTAALPSLTKQPIKSVDVNAAQPDAATLGSMLNARVFQYDIIIICEDFLPENVGQHFFSPLSTEFTDLFPNVTLYQENTGTEQCAYGLQIPADSQTRFSDSYTGNQSCYLFISAESVNFNQLNGNGKPGNDAALKAVCYLLETTL